MYVCVFVSSDVYGGFLVCIRTCLMLIIVACQAWDGPDTESRTDGGSAPPYRCPLSPSFCSHSFHICYLIDIHIFILYILTDHIKFPHTPTRGMCGGHLCSQPL